MFSMFCVFKSNLNQLSVSFGFNDSQDIKQISLEVIDTSLVMTIDGKQTLFTFKDCIELMPNSLRQLNAFQSTNSKQNVCLNCLEIGFTVCAQMDVIPPKPSLANISLPVNSELMNDWIFCCNHNHEETDERKKFDEVCHRLNTLSVDSEDNKSLRSLGPVLSTFDQILKLLAEKSDNKFLFESRDKKFSLFLNLFNNEFFMSSVSHRIDSISDTELSFENKTSVFYKLFKCHKSETDSQLNRYRLAFDVHYFMVELQLFESLLKSLLDSTKRVLPLSLRYDTENALYFGYL